MQFRLGERHADAQNRALPLRRDAHGDQQRTGHHGAAHTDFFVAGVQKQIRDFTQRTFAPSGQFIVQGLHGAADLHAGDLAAAKLFHDGGHLARRDALQIHLGDRQFESSLAARAAFQRRGVELDARVCGTSSSNAPTRVCTVLGL